MYCRDIKQLCDELGNPMLPEQGKGEHNALADAKWNKQAYEFLQDLTAKTIALTEQQAIALRDFISENSNPTISEDVAPIFDELQQKFGW